MRTTTRIGTAALAGCLVVLAGCAGRGQNTGAGNGSAAAITSSAPASDDLTGPPAPPDGDASMSSSDRSEPVGPDALAGRTYVSTAVTGRPVAAGTVISLRFGGGEFHASAGCNVLTGTYTTDGGRLTVGEMRIERPLPCPSTVSEETSWLSHFLGGLPTWRLGGHRLILVSGSATIHLTDRVALPHAGSSGATGTTGDPGGARRTDSGQ